MQILLPPKSLPQPTEPRQQSGNAELIFSFPMTVRYIWGLQECCELLTLTGWCLRGLPQGPKERTLAGGSQAGAHSFSLIFPHLPLGKAAKITLKTLLSLPVTCSFLHGESQVGLYRGRKVGKRSQGFGYHLGKKEIS